MAIRDVSKRGASFDLPGLSKSQWLLVVCGAFLVVSFFAGVGIGAVPIAPHEVLLILLRPLGIDLGADIPAHYPTVLTAIRIPRVVLAAFVGGSLAVAGASMQGFFRNPLADPTLIGVSGGAAFAAAFTIVLGERYLGAFMDIAGLYAVPVMAFFGALISVVLIYRLAQYRKQTIVTTMLLAGIAVNAIAMSSIGYLTFISDDQQLRRLTFWTLGSLANATWQGVLPAVAIMAISMVFLLRLRKALNAYLLGESEAHYLGVDVKRLKRHIILFTALAVGGAVSLTGVIGFVGLVVPHIVRLMTGPDHSFVLPGSILLGAGLVIFADIVARMLVLPAELPIGVVMSTIGAPFFLWLLMKHKAQAGGG